MFAVIQQNAVVLSSFGRFARKEKKVRISQDANEFVQVKIVHAKRNKDGKAEYTTVDTTKVFDATPDEVLGVIIKALQAEAAKAKK